MTFIISPGSVLCKCISHKCGYLFYNSDIVYFICLQRALIPVYCATKQRALHVGKFIAWILIALVRFYQTAISPLFPSTCRYMPTCSTYMIQALKIHGPVKGLILGLRRFSRCHPWGGSGFDPVPPKEHRHEKQ